MKNEVKFFSFGNGDKTLVMLPGASVKPISLSKGAVCSAYSEFSKDYTIYLFDYIEDVREGTTVKDIANDVAEKMNELGLKNAYIFACSLGGCIAQCLALDYPELVGKLLLASTFSKQNDFTIKAFSAWEEFSKNGEKVLLNQNMQKLNYSKEFYEKFKEVFKTLETAGSKEEVARFAHVSHALITYDRYEELNKIKCDVLVIGSKDDKTLGPDASVEIANKLNCPIYLYEGYGHAVYDEAPDCKEKVKSFFEKIN